MIGFGQKTFIQSVASAMLVFALIGAPMLLGEDPAEETIAPFADFTATPVPVAIDIERGQGVEVNLTLDVRALDAGSILIESDLGDSRFLASVASDHQDVEQSGNSRIDWTCDATECSIAATVRVDAFTDLRGEIFITAYGGPSSGDLAPDAAAAIIAGDATVGFAKTHELAHSLLEYPDTGDQAPHGGLELIEYDLGDPSDAIELVIRPLLGEITIEDGGSGAPPQWATGLIPLAQSELCKPACAGSTIVQMGPADFSNLEYQLLAYSDRAGAGASATATRTPASAITEIGFVTMTADLPVAAIPITVMGDPDRLRIMGDVGVRGRGSFVNMRPVGETAFEPAASWIAPQVGVTDYELAISTPDTQAGDVELSWTIALFELPGDTPAAATIAVGDVAAAAFTVGAAGDPAEFASGDGGGGSAVPWGIAGLALVGAAGYGGYRYRSKRKAG